MTASLKDMGRLAARAFVGASLLIGLGTTAALPQQVTGTRGSPSATTTIDGKQLPPPDPRFGGVIKGRCPAIEAVVATARGAAQERAKRIADHHR